MLFNLISFIILNGRSTYKAVLWLRIREGLRVDIETCNSISLEPPFENEILKVSCTLKVYLRIVWIYIWMQVDLWLFHMQKRIRIILSHQSRFL